MKWLLFTLGALLLITTYIMRPNWAHCDYTLIKTPNGETIKAEIASTAEERIRGLSFRENLPEKNGMLFLFSTPTIARFWMKDTLIPLDIVWLKDKQITEIATLQPPVDNTIPAYTPNTLANAVLEINAGEAGILGLNVGSRLEWGDTCSTSPL